MAFLLLIVALALFWVSTRQFPLLMRLAIWSAGVALLLFAASSQVDLPDHFGLRQAIENMWSNRTDLQNSGVAQALHNNAGTVARFVPQLMDFFLVGGVVLAGLSVLAFTPGEHFERILRPSIVGVIGFSAGAVATLAVVAIGLGGQIKPATFIGIVTEKAMSGENAIHDGDTFWLGEVSLRLWGVDAPELSQTCRDAPDCSEASRRHLQDLLVGNLVQCDQERSLNHGRLVESFGRPLVRCWILQTGNREDVGARMISDGYAVRYRHDPRYYGDVREAFSLGCTLRPDLWRSRDADARAARAEFEERGSVSRANGIGCSQ